MKAYPIEIIDIQMVCQNGLLFQEIMEKGGSRYFRSLIRVRTIMVNFLDCCCHKVNKGFFENVLSQR